MKKGMCWGGLPGDLSMEERLDLAAKAGFDGVEPRIADAGSGDLVNADSTDADLAKVVRMVKDRGLDVCSLMGGGVSVRVYPIVSDDPAVRAKGKDAIRRALHITAALDAEVLLLVPHWVNDAVRYDYCYDRAKEALQELGPEAETLGVTIGVENVWNKFLLSPIEYARFVDEVGSPAVQAYFDAGNMLIWGYPHHWAEILGPRIARVHIKDFKIDVGTGRGFAQLLHGDLDWPKLMKSLRGIGYDGYVTAEVGLLTHFPVESVYDTATAMDRIFALK
ncbi:MAG: sugar phosphate isomerase/epimerase [Anaerolineae bacterium]|nr:sugar phosphate isomerase/epimerase [Anaerolineae bacterium]